MISFKQFLQEDREDEDDSRVYTATKMTVSAMIDWIEKNASNYLNNLSSMPPILRGMGENQQGMINSDKFNRRSANTKNYYTLFLDNSPAWAKYPKRSKGLICTNDPGIARGFGDVHYVFPKDSNKIGICPEDDFWASFDIAGTLGFKDISLDASDMMSLTDTLLKLADEEGSETDFNTLAASLKKINVEVLEQLAAKTKDRFAGWQAKAAKAILDKGYKNFYDVYVDVFNPTKNNFDMVTAGEITLSSAPRRELWIQGECVVFPKRYADWFHKGEDRVLIEQFITKYRIK